MSSSDSDKSVLLQYTAFIGVVCFPHLHFSAFGLISEQTTTAALHYTLAHRHFLGALLLVLQLVPVLYSLISSDVEFLRSASVSFGSKERMFRGAVLC